MSKTVKISFMKLEDGEIMAVFLDIPWNNSSSWLTSYCYNGQHGPCNRQVLYNLEKATEKEYQPLFDELLNIGYTNIEII